MQTLSQKPSYWACVLSTKIMNDRYKSINDIIFASGYRYTSSFLRDSVANKCIDELKEMEKNIDSIS